MPRLGRLSWNSALEHQSKSGVENFFIVWEFEVGMPSFSLDAIFSFGPKRVRFTYGTCEFEMKGGVFGKTYEMRINGIPQLRIKGDGAVIYEGQAEAEVSADGALSASGTVCSCNFKGREFTLVGEPGNDAFFSTRCGYVFFIDSQPVGKIRVHYPPFTGVAGEVETFDPSTTWFLWYCIARLWFYFNSKEM